MRLNRIWSVCSCGGYAQPISMWVSENKSLVVCGVCVKCEQAVNTEIPFAELIKTCPKPDIKAIEQAIAKRIEQITGQGFTEGDLKFLHEMHITEDK